MHENGSMYADTSELSTMHSWTLPNKRSSCMHD